MDSPRAPYHRAVCALLLIAAAVVLLAALPARTPAARAASVGQLQQQISSGQSQLGGLAGALHAASSRLAAISGSVATIEARIAHVQADLDAKRGALLRLRGELQAARTHLAQLENYQARAEGVLSRQLTAAYENDNPDLITVVLEAKGFKDLLERLSFAARVRRQTTHIVTDVRAARTAVAAQATRLGGLEQRQQKLTAQVLLQRNVLTRDRVALVTRELAAARSRQAKAGALAGARARIGGLQRQLSHLQAQQAAAATAASVPASAPASAGGASPAGSSGGFTFPLPKSAVSPPGTWSQDQGVDMSAPGDTPEFAVCSGTIVLHGIGGFGPWAPVLHCDGSVGGYGYVYYGHAGPANQLPVGTHVSAGQVMSSIGPGIVGISTGPHIEIGFADASGGPIGGGSASTMLSLLQSSY